MAELVTDPNILAQLNASQGGLGTPVTDPAILAQLNAPQAAPAAPSWMDLLTGGKKAQEFSAGMDPRLAAEAQRQATTPQELGQRHEGYAGEFLKGVPVAGAAMPQTEAMTRVEREYPWSTAGARIAGGTTALAPAMIAAPGAMGLTGSLLARSAASGASGAGISLADQLARQGAEAAGGAPAPNPSATFEALGLPNTGYRPVDAALMAAAIGPAATVTGAGVGAALGPAVSKSAQLLNKAGVVLSPGQQLGGSAETVGKLARSFPLSGMEKPRTQAIPTFNRAAEHTALAPLAGPEFQNTGVLSKIPGTWEEATAASKAAQPPTQVPAGAPMSQPPATPGAAAVTGPAEAPALGSFGRPREPATHVMEIRTANGSTTHLSGTADELEHWSNAAQLENPNASFKIAPKSQWIGASMPVRRVPPLPPEGAAAISGGVPGAAGQTGVSEAATLPPGSEFRGNLSGGGLPGAANEPGMPGQSAPKPWDWQDKGNIGRETPDYVAARGGELPGDAAEVAAYAARTGDITPGFQGRQFVRQQVQKAYDIALNGAPGETPPALLANAQELRAKTANIDIEGVKPETRQQYRDIMDRYIFSRFRTINSGAPDSTITRQVIDGPSLANGFQEIDKIAAAARRRGGDGHDLASALLDAKQSLTKSLTSQDPVAAARLKAANEAWSHYAELRAAGRNAASEKNGQFVPAELSSGAIAADKSVNKIISSEGRTRYGEFARAGMDVGVEKTKPPSNLEQLGAAGVTLATGALANPWVPLVAYPTAWTYSSPWVQALARGYLQHGAPMARTAISQGLPRATMMTTPPSEQEALYRALGGGQ
jgi:hypothetical protein